MFFSAICDSCPVPRSTCFAKNTTTDKNFQKCLHPTKPNVWRAPNRLRFRPSPWRFGMGVLEALQRIHSFRHPHNSGVSQKIYKKGRNKQTTQWKEGRKEAKTSGCSVLNTPGGRNGSVAQYVFRDSKLNGRFTVQVRGSCKTCWSFFHAIAVDKKTMGDQGSGRIQQR